MFNTGRLEERMQNDLLRRSLRDSRPRMEDECRRCDHVGAAAQAGVARGLGSIMILVLTRNLRRNVAAVRLQQIAGKHLRCHEEQQKHRRDAKQLGQDPHHSHFATRAPGNTSAALLRWAENFAIAQHAPCLAIVALSMRARTSALWWGLHLLSQAAHANGHNIPSQLVQTLEVLSPIPPERFRKFAP